jgi:hypothetical protein
MADSFSTEEPSESQTVRSTWTARDYGPKLCDPVLVLEHFDYIILSKLLAK